MAKQKIKRKNYQFSKEQKIKIVQDLESGKVTRLEAMEKYNIGAYNTIKEWLIKYGSNKDFLVNKQYSKVDHRLAAYRILSGESTVEDTAREMDIGISSVRKWVSDYKDEFKVNPQPTATGRKASSGGDKEAKKELADLRLKVAGLEMMIDIAEKELGIDIRKKSGTKQ